MFNLEIKRISLKSIVFSAYPFVVFVFTLLQAALGLADLINLEAGLFKAIMQVLLYAVIYTGVIVVFTMFAAFIYNTVVNFGVKGIRLSFTEVEETAEEEEEAPAEEEK